MNILQERNLQGTEGSSCVLKDELTENMTSLDGKGAVKGSQGKKRVMSHLEKEADKSGSV